MKLQSKGNVTQLRAELLIKRKKRSHNGPDTWEVVRARGHLDEINALKLSSSSADAKAKQAAEEGPLVLIEGQVLGGGAFSRVSIVTGKPPDGSHDATCLTEARNICVCVRVQKSSS